MLVLRAFVDDSGSDGQDTPYVLAGFVAPLDDWEAFVEPWRAGLNKSPPIGYFKMREATALEGQFQIGWTRPLAHQRALELAEIVPQHAKARVGIGLNRNVFNRVVKSASPVKEYHDPYFLCFYSLAVHLAYKLPDIFGDEIECRIVFDSQGDTGLRAVSWWPLVSRMLDERGRNIFPDPPTFGNDKRLLPLQAADMYAWIARRIGSDSDAPEFVDAIMNMWARLPSLTKTLDYNYLTGLGAGLVIANARLEGHLGPERT